MAIMGHMLAKQVQIRGLQNIPYDGPALIVADHPTGIADGIVSNYLICQRRNDAYFFANSDILRVLPQLSDCITPLEWRVDRRSYTKTRETMECVRTATDAGRFGIIFPSGRLAKRHGLKLYERPWMASAAMFAKKKFELHVILVNIQARNSALFYIFDAIHPTMRDVTLFHQTLNKTKQRFEITAGPPIAAATLPKKSDEPIVILRQKTLALGYIKPSKQSPKMLLSVNTIGRTAMM